MLTTASEAQMPYSSNRCGDGDNPRGAGSGAVPGLADDRDVGHEPGAQVVRQVCQQSGDGEVIGVERGEHFGLRGVEREVAADPN